MIPSRDSAFFNSVLNHPSVFEGVRFGIDPPLDATALIEDGHNVLLANEYGGILFVAKSDCVYEAHAAFLPGGRGKRVISAAIDSVHYMFNRAGALRLDAAIPVGNRAVVGLVRAAGFRFLGEAALMGVPVRLYALTKAEFLRCQ